MWWQKLNLMVTKMVLVTILRWWLNPFWFPSNGGNQTHFDCHLTGANKFNCHLVKTFFFFLPSPPFGFFFLSFWFFALLVLFVSCLFHPHSPFIFFFCFLVYPSLLCFHFSSPILFFPFPWFLIPCFVLFSFFFRFHLVFFSLPLLFPPPHFPFFPPFV